MQAATLFRDVRAVVFDLDGVLIRTDRLQCESYRGALRQWNRELDPEFFKTLVDKPRREICRSILRRQGLDRRWTDLADAYAREYQRLLAETPIPVIAEAEEFLRTLPGGKYHRALASDSSMDEIEQVLERTGLGRCFDTVISGDELPNKPEPDLYQCAIEVAAVTAWSTVVLEDSGPGVVAAVRAGARVVAVPHDATRHHDFSPAHIRVDSLAQLLPFLKAAAGL